MEEVQPNAQHRFCTRHIWENFRKRWKGKEYRDYFWRVVKCTNMSEFEAYKEKKKKRKMHPKEREYLDNIPLSS